MIQTDDSAAAAHLPEGVTMWACYQLDIELFRIVSIGNLRSGNVHSVNDRLEHLAGLEHARLERARLGRARLGRARLGRARLGRARLGRAGLEHVQGGTNRGDGLRERENGSEREAPPNERRREKPYPPAKRAFSLSLYEPFTEGVNLIFFTAI